MRIGDRHIGHGHPPYIIAELGVNHDGDPDRAVALAHKAADAGADAVKLQLFRTDLLMGREAALAAYQADAGERDPWAMLRRLELPLDAMASVLNAARARGLHAVITVFSTELIADAESLGVDAYKTASPDVIHEPLLRGLAATGRPLIISTGAATAEEVRRAREVIDAAADRVAFTHCVSSYPTACENASLGGVRAVAELVASCQVGYSDHTASVETGAWAVAAGATLLEKHFTDDRTRAGPDHAASLEPNGFREYALAARAAARGERYDDVPPRALGDGTKAVLDCERDVRRVSRQSLTAVRDLPAGHRLERADLVIRRPGLGLSPGALDFVLGRALARGVAQGACLRAADIAEPGPH